MSDHLGAIAAKSLDMAPVVQPRPVSLFEPDHTEGTLGASDRFSEGAMNGSSDFDHVETTETRLTADIQPRTRLHQPRANSIMDHPVPLKPLKSMDPVPPRPQQDSDRIPQTLHGLPETIIDKKSPRIPSQVTRRLPAGEQHPSRVKPSIVRMETDLPKVPGNPEVTGMVPVSRGSVAPSLRMTKTMPFQSSQEPTIQVTIGRIEVRATTPPVSSPRQRPAPKTMSLDEYLGKRNGGGR